MTASPAHAALTWKTGTKLSSPPPLTSFSDESGGFVYSRAWDGDSCNQASETTGYFRGPGDYIYVEDECRDGRSAVVRIRATNDASYGRVCTNPHGRGTWAVCNFDWAEGRSYLVTAGVYNGSTGFIRWDNNQSVLWAGG